MFFPHEPQCLLRREGENASFDLWWPFLLYFSYVYSFNKYLWIYHYELAIGKTGMHKADENLTVKSNSRGIVRRNWILGTFCWKSQDWQTGWLWVQEKEGRRGWPWGLVPEQLKALRCYSREGRPVDGAGMRGEQQFSWVLNLRCQLSHSVKLLHTQLEHETGIQKGDQTRDIPECPWFTGGIYPHGADQSSVPMGRKEIYRLRS